MDGQEATVAERFGRFATATGWDDLPAGVRHEARRSVLNLLGAAVAGARDPAIDAAVAVLRPLSGPPAAGLIGRPERLDVAAAAFVNAAAGNLLDYDDTHLDTVIHPTAPVLPAALALAEQQGMTGRDVLLAFVLGAEVECRIGNAVSPGHYDRGWHITATCGTFGAAVAAGRLLGLDAATLGHALGIAAGQPSGIVENLAAAAKNVGVGAAARNGILAALFARAGCRAAPRAIEGPRGWAAATGDAFDAARAFDRLGTHWELARNTYKPYPAGIVFHAVIDACLDLRAGGVAAEQVAAVEVRGDGLLLARGDRPVANERDAKVSIHHAVAAGLVAGSGGLDAFSAGFVARPDVTAMRARVTPVRDDGLPRGAATVVVRLVDGREVVSTVLHPSGSGQNPLADGEIEDKVRECVRIGGGTADAGRLIEAVWNLDRAASLAGLLRAAGAQTA